MAGGWGAAVIAQDLIDAAADALNFARDAVTDDADPGTSDFLRWINAGLAELQRYGDWPWLKSRATRTTVANSDDLDLPSDFAAFLPDSRPYYSDGNQWLFEYASRERIESLRAAGSQLSSDRPYLWSDWFNAGTLKHAMTLWPRPTAANDIIVPYRRTLSNLTARSDVVAVPLEMQDVALHAARTLADELHGKLARSPLRDGFERALISAWGLFGSPLRTQAVTVLQPITGGRHRDPIDSTVVFVGPVT